MIEPTIDAPGAVAEPFVADAPEAATFAAACTQAQIRRFIKSRSYVPIHELRRRFALAGMLGELVFQGDVGYELLLDPTSPLIVGVFPVRPVQRS